MSLKCGIVSFLKKISLIAVMDNSNYKVLTVYGNVGIDCVGKWPVWLRLCCSNSSDKGYADFMYLVVDEGVWIGLLARHEGLFEFLNG